MTAGPLLRARALTAGYGRRPVVGPVELDVYANDAIALVGPNGVGKSTLLKTLAGLIPPVHGSVDWEGRDVTRVPAFARARRGVVLAGEHRGNVLRSLTVAENLRLARNAATGSSTHDVETLFPRLVERRQQIAGTMSGGEQQMLSMAMALCLGPRCLLIDEPSAGLAPVVLGDIKRALEALRHSGLALVIAEQRPDVVHGLCDRVAVVGGGTVRFLDGADFSADALVAQYFAGEKAEP